MLFAREKTFFPLEMAATRKMPSVADAEAREVAKMGKALRKVRLA